VDLQLVQSSGSGTLMMKGEPYATAQDIGIRWIADTDGVDMDAHHFLSWVLFYMACSERSNSDDSIENAVRSFFRLVLRDDDFLDPRIFENQCSQIVRWLQVKKLSESYDLFLLRYEKNLLRWVAEFERDDCYNFLVSTASVITSGSVIFSTSKGRLGTTGCHIILGDTIALLAGSHFPVVLRSQEECWRYVGGAFVQEIMDGEAWSRDLNTPTLDHSFWFNQ
jgi:hypothetical protein